MQNLTKSLFPFQRRVALLSILELTLFLTAIFLASILSVLWVDSIVPLSPSSRWGISRFGALAGLLARVVICCVGLRSWNTKRVAILIDHHAATGGTMATGWELNQSQLHESPRAALHGQSSSFANYAIRSAMGQLERFSPSQIAPWRQLCRPLIAIGGVGFFAILMTLFAPNYMWNQWRRIAYPHLDIPPYSDLMLYLEDKELSIQYGDDIKILASSSKKPRERLELVTQTNNGKEYVLPMLSRGSTQWQAMLTDVHDSMDYFVRSGSARSERGKLTVQWTPKITSSRIRITPPEYTRKAVYDGPIPENGIAGLIGTEIVLTLESNRELSVGEIQFRFSDNTESTLEMLPERKPASKEVVLKGVNENASSRSVSVAFTLNREASFEARVRGVDELLSVDSIQSKIRMIQDAKPAVRIVEPKPISFATPDIQLPVVIAAEDDFGLSSLRLYRSLNGSPATADSIPTDGEARLDATVSLALPSYDLRPGDEIELFARAEDNDPSGFKGVESKKTTIKIISVREFQEILMEQQGADALRAKYDAAQRYLEKMSAALAAAEEAAKNAEQSPNDAAAAADLQQKLMDAEKAASQAAQEIEKIAQNASELELDQQLSKMLQEIASDASKAAGMLKDMAEEQKGERPLSQQEKEDLNSMRDKVQSDRKDIQEEAIDTIDSLNQAMKLQLDEEQFESLAERQREIAERMESLQTENVDDAATERRMAEMEAEQEELRQQLQDLVQSIREHAEQLPNDEENQGLKQSASDFANDLQESQAEPFMRGAQRSLLDSKFEQAAEQAASAADELEELMKQGDRMGQEAQQNASQQFKPGRAGFDPKQALEQMKQKFGRGKSRGSQLGKGSGQGQGESEGDASTPQGNQRGGNSRRNTSPANTGLYGSNPKPSPSSQGRSDRISQGAATSSAIAKQDQGKSSSPSVTESDAAAQGLQSIPLQYRSRVSDYMQRILEKPKSP
jgi:hypothetical protein